MWLNYRHFYLLGLATILCGLGWSNVLMSIGQLIIIGNWIIEFDFKRKLKALQKNKIIWIVLLLFFVHIIGLFWTEDFKYALKDINIKLPLLAFPIVIGTANRLKLKEWKLLLRVYVLTLLILTLASMWKYISLWGDVIHDKRELSIYISHIRYGLNLAFAAILLVWYKPISFKGTNLLLSSWFFACLVLLELYTGLFIFIALITVLLVMERKRVVKNRTARNVLYLFLFVTVVFVGYETVQVYNNFHKEVVLDYDQENLTASKTVNGEQYGHEGYDTRKENGVFTRRFVARSEIEREWNKASSVSFKNENGIDNPIAQRLYRYMSSKGLKKDSLAFSTLTKEEITAIENGAANVYYVHHNRLQNRLHKTLYELQEYKRTGNASGYSLAMRLEYWKTATRIIKKNFIWGVGTGDIKTAFAEEYEITNSKLNLEYRKRAHNQYLTLFACFGVVGFFIILFSMYYPTLTHNRNPMLLLLFVVLVSLSFLTEDTIETQAGITLYALFYNLIIFGLNDYQAKTSR